MERAIVMHGAWYANETMISKFGRLGRSYGCLSVPKDIHKELINSISHRTILFIYHSSEEYKANSIFFRYWRTFWNAIISHLREYMMKSSLIRLIIII